MHALYALPFFSNLDPDYEDLDLCTMWSAPLIVWYNCSFTGGIGVALPASNTNVYEMNITKAGGVDNEAVDIDDEAKSDKGAKDDEASKKDDDDRSAKGAAATVVTVAAAADAAEPPEKKDMATDNPEFIKYDDKDDKE